MTVNMSDHNDVNFVVFEKDQYGGTFDRPWILSTLRFLNGHGDTVQHGR